jgi:hypothetical protein
MVEARERNVFGPNLFLDRIFFHDVRPAKVDVMTAQHRRPPSVLTLP